MISAGEGHLMLETNTFNAANVFDIGEERTENERPLCILYVLAS